jgi:gamma-glutamylcyclotransferase (GGCT)/AIG2-like uncharacterized protein YtfP
MEQVPVFVYGTLKPGEKMFRHISHTVRDAVPATIPGCLYDTPFGYPLLVNPGLADASAISGVVLLPLEEQYEEMMRIIDVIEGEAGFEKGEMEVTLESGNRLTAIVYFYREPPPYARPFYSTDWP